VVFKGPSDDASARKKRACAWIDWFLLVCAQRWIDRYMHEKPSERGDGESLIDVLNAVCDLAQFSTTE
jgi:hypothetical protein